MSKVKLVSLAWNLRQTCGDLASIPADAQGPASMDLCCAENAFAAFEPHEDDRVVFEEWKAEVTESYLKRPLLDAAKLKEHIIKEASQRVKKSAASLIALGCVQSSWRAELNDTAPFQTLVAKAKPAICRKEVVTALKARVDETEKDRGAQARLIAPCDFPGCTVAVVRKTPPHCFSLKFLLSNKFNLKSKFQIVTPWGPRFWHLVGGFWSRAREQPSWYGLSKP